MIVKNLKKKIKENPKDLESLFQLSLILAKSRKLNLAKDYLIKAIEIEPNFLAALVNLGNIEKELGNLVQSINFYKKVIKINPNYVNAYYNLGIVYFELGDLKSSEISYRQAIKIKPDYINAHYNLAKLSQELGNLNDSINFYKTVIKLNPNFVGAYNNIGLIFAELGRFDEAIKSYNKAIEIKPDHANSYNNLGLALTELGNFDNAITYYKKALRYEPENLAHLYYLKILENKTIDLKEKNKIYKIIKSKKKEYKNLAYGHFLIAKYDQKNKNYKKEFNNLIKGHDFYLKSQNNSFSKNINYWLNELPKIRDLSYEHSIRLNQNDLSNIRPIFIVGVPRCGSTLVEKIIASGKNKILMGEEAGVLQLFFHKNGIVNKKLITNNDINDFNRGLTQLYKERVLTINKDNLIFTDKSLENFFYIGLIKQIFPNATIINCKRNALYSIMSIIKNNLSKMSWAHNLKNIFDYFDIYFHTIDFFKKKYPGFIYDLELDKLINNPINESKKLFQFCNLEWSKECLEFYKRKDIVSKTASNIQIRKPIFKNKKNKYYEYKQFLNKFSRKYNWFEN